MHLQNIFAQMICIAQTLEMVVSQRFLLTQKLEVDFLLSLTNAFAYSNQISNIRIIHLKAYKTVQHNNCTSQLYVSFIDWLMPPYMCCRHMVHCGGSSYF